MPWYKSGSVSVAQNSNAVIGSGTAFLANSRVGDAFRGPDGGWYEVINIASDTAMAIAPPYQGATSAVGIYALAPMQGYVKDSADALRALVNTYGTKLAALGTTGNYDILPVDKGGTGIADLSAFIQTLLNDADAAAGRTTLGAAKSGANSDITSLSGLTTALSVAQGGTGVATIAALLASLLSAGAYAKSNIVGAVNDAAGIPSGAIIESGSNANGSYTKWADGTMICRRFINLGTNSITVPAGSLFISADPVPRLNWAVAFVGSVPIVSHETLSSSGAGWNSRASDPTLSQSPLIYLLETNSANRTVTLDLIAIGRWKA